MFDLKRLADPFPSDDIEWRIGQCGQSNGDVWATCLAYIQARAIMDRLDSVVGIDNWKADYVVLPSGVICNLSIRCENGWVTKQDGAEPTDIESFKGGISSALKRAGSVWGIGRYLYKLESGFANIVKKGTKGSIYGKVKDNGQIFYWLPPALPEWALPASENKSPANIVPRGKDLEGNGNISNDNGYVIPNGAYARKRVTDLPITEARVELERLESLPRDKQLPWHLQFVDRLKEYVNNYEEFKIPQEQIVVESVQFCHCGAKLAYSAAKGVWYCSDFKNKTVEHVKPFKE